MQDYDETHTIKAVRRSTVLLSSDSDDAAEALMDKASAANARAKPGAANKKAKTAAKVAAGKRAAAAATSKTAKPRGRPRRNTQV